MSELIESAHMEKDIITVSPSSMEIIREKIHIIRGKKVMLDRDLAELYQVPTKQLNRAVRRNIDRFPDDFMFKLTKDQMDNLKCQFGTSSYGGTRKPPLAFIEQGIAMLSSVLNSKLAIQMNIQIIRIFTKLREMIDAYKELREKGVSALRLNKLTRLKPEHRPLSLNPPSIPAHLACRREDAVTWNHIPYRIIANCRTDRTGHIATAKTHCQFPICGC